MASKAFLSAAEKRDLMEHIAGKSENYDRYLEWCDARGIQQERRYTKDTLHKWVGRRRDAIRVLREQHRVEIRKESMLDKSARVERLEAMAARLEKKLETFDIPTTGSDGTPIVVPAGTYADYVRLEEQLRKTLESIAKERGEYAKADPDDNPLLEVQNELARQAIAALNRGLLAEPVIEGQVRELS